MKRSLESPSGAIPTFVVERLRQHRVRGRATATGVRIVLPSGAHHDFRLRVGSMPLRPDEPVYLWWGNDGPVCQPVAELRAASPAPGSAADQIERARAAMAAARRTRTGRGVDILLS